MIEHPATEPGPEQQEFPSGSQAMLPDQGAAESHQRDHELIAAFKGGDRAAFSELVLKYETRVYNHCLRMVNDEEESQDLTQEVFLKVYRNIRNYEHTYAFYTWLYRITVNCCIDYLRKKRRHAQEVSLTPPADDDPGEAGREHSIPDETFVPDKQYLNRELSSVLNQAIGQLSEKLRAIIVLKEIEGFSYEEIAEILNCSRGTVKSRLFRARERLKELLAPYVAE
ncbi:MAG TPA: sigma-70 family RNA polymerase sigma factor [bacterium]|nr:sigma-70 family RNA polymerase sigma factor [bacterium]